MFPAKTAAYEYFAHSTSRRFAQADSLCVMCRRECETPPVKFLWRANVHTRKTVLWSFLLSITVLVTHHLYSSCVVVEFSTFHRLCVHCQRRHRWRSIQVAVLHKLLFTAMIVLLFLTVPLVVFLVAIPFIAPELVWRVSGVVLVGVAALATVIWGFEICRKLRFPVRFAGLDGFRFIWQGCAKQPDQLVHPIRLFPIRTAGNPSPPANGISNRSTTA